MGTALMQAAAPIAGPGNIAFTDIDITKAEDAAAKIKGLTFHSNIAAVQAADYIFLAVKPQIYSMVLEEIAPALKERLNAGQTKKNPVLISMAPGWTLEKIQSCLGAKVPVVRIMPNTPALISKGLIALCLSPEVSADSAAVLEKILQGSGLVETLEEKYFDAITGLSGSGPAFVYLFIEALADGGVRAGLPRDKALRYAAQTVLGSAAMVLETGKHPGELKDMGTSPGGTTIAGVAALEKGAFRGTVISAVEAAWQRAVELGRQ
jgi:pyrroline-5-carboxylate reductase